MLLPPANAVGRGLGPAGVFAEQKHQGGSRPSPTQGIVSISCGVGLPPPFASLGHPLVNAGGEGRSKSTREGQDTRMVWMQGVLPEILSKRMRMRSVSGVQERVISRRWQPVW